MACAVTLYEAYRQRAVKGHYTEQPKLSEEQQEQLFERWGKILRNGGYRNRGTVIGKADSLIPPVFVEHNEDTPPIKIKRLPITKFDL